MRAGMAAADADDATLREFIAVLDAHRKECERECKYVEADIAKRRLAELRALAESREVDTVASRQHAQRQRAEEQRQGDEEDVPLHLGLVVELGGKVRVLAVVRVVRALPGLVDGPRAD